MLGVLEFGSLKSLMGPWGVWGLGYCREFRIQGVGFRIPGVVGVFKVHLS